MKKILIPAIILAVMLTSCSGNKTETQTSEVSSQTSEVPSTETVTIVDLTPQEFMEQSQNGIVLDVRTAPEVAEGKIPGAVAIDYFQQDFLSKVNSYPKDSEIFVYCAIGARSQDAAQQLIEQGFTKVYHLTGGIKAWNQSGFPIE
jgi:rhodanese-related sulfurtransferase